jgi:hypothetical protein
MNSGRHLASLAFVSILMSGCASANSSPMPSAPPTRSSPTIAAAAAPTASPSISTEPTATATLPADPVLLGTLSDEFSAVYQIAVAPSPSPMDKAVAMARATKIGSLVGFAAPDSIELSGNQTVDQTADPTWLATWGSHPAQKCPDPTCIGDFPIDPAYPVIRLEMDMHGSVLSFSRRLGPTQSKPARLISATQARTAAGGKPDRAELVWTLQPPSSQAFRLAWRLDYGVASSSADATRCVAIVDAGSAAVLFSGCVS